MADVATPSADAMFDASAEKKKPEKPDEELYKANLKKAEKDSVISQDELKRMETDVQKITDEAVRRVDEALKTKEHEIMQV